MPAGFVGSLAKGARQRRLLVAEGVPFRGERVDMALASVAELGAASPPDA